MYRPLITLIFLSFLVAGCGKGDEATQSQGSQQGSEHSHEHADHQCGSCQKGQAGETIWCSHCKVGFVDGKKVDDKAAVETAQKAAAPAPAAAATCAGCNEAKADCDCHADGAACTCGAGKEGRTTWCEKCDVGYINGEKSKDKAAVEAALKAAAPAPAAAEICAGCSKAKADCNCHGHDHEKGTCACAAGKAGGTVWCDHCGSGYIKGVKSKDKAAVEAALKPATPAPTPAGE